ncbi:polysaccharide pyruvyl transferase family protein [Brucella pituitosa]|uniref:Polysaccharide pyruvyl transferase family protein n=1 Tax=Brucella pituitosa TaxID=571256 RepID=A0ABS3K0E4_9HYPH|nr:polysaccharide pyruvyl transferase family protein [Brucella pituitosa]MBO1040395.1 polysaccharide pyruvyl transferase family protein [Brucella pituitosa]
MKASRARLFGENRFRFFPIGSSLSGFKKIESYPIMTLYLPNNDPLLSELRKYSQATVRFFPHSGNLGDGLITYATMQLLDHFGINYTTHRQEERFDDEIIFIGGGGNLVEGRYEDVAKLIWEHRETNRVILFPQSIVGYEDIIKETHNNLTVFCRDKVSFEHCTTVDGRNDRIHLCQDAALYLGPKHFEQAKVIGSGCLNAMRTDGESLGGERDQNNMDISLAWNGDVWTNPAFVRAAAISMAEFVSQYREVKTDRLHVAIMSALLGREVTMYPNNYFKNQAVFEHSIKERFNNVVFEERTTSQTRAREYVETPTIDAQSLERKLDRERELHNSTRSKFRLQIQQLTAQYNSDTSLLKAELSDLKNDIEILRNQANNSAPPGKSLDDELSLLQEKLKVFQSSKSWRYTKPFRKIRSFF